MYHRDIAGHYIRQNHSKSMPKRLLVLDTETTALKKGAREYHRLKLGWTVLVKLGGHGEPITEVWKHWASPYLLCHYIEDCSVRDTALVIAGVNIFFDLQSCDFFYYLTRWGWRLDFCFDKGTTYILIASKDRRVIKVVSTTNYWTSSARSLGNLFGMHKADPEFAAVTSTDLLCYCFRDTEIALEAMYRYLSFIYENDLGMFRVSRASQAYAAFRHRFMTTKLYAHTDETVRKLEQAAYFGGRVECFRLGKLRGGPFSCYDVNSMYPYIMRTTPMPIKCVDYWANPPRADLEDILRTHGAIAKVLIETEDPVYATHYGGKTIFPIGRFVAYLCTGALRQAASHGHIKRVYRCAIYETAIVFRDYIDFFYAIREEAKRTGNKPWDRMTKIFMNSLYGKFGQKRPIIESDEDIDSPDYKREEVWDHETQKTLITTTMMNRRITHYGEEACPGTVIAIPAHITEAARLLLWSICSALRMNGLAYIDTDSLFLPSENATTIKHPISKTDLGALSLKWESQSLEIRGCKDYINDFEIVLKGVPKSALKLSPGTYQYTEWPKQRTHLKLGMDRYYMTVRREKTLSIIYDKGVVQLDGTVLPFRFPL